MNLEKIAEEIKLELHDKHMMYIDGEDSVTHRWCKQIIWKVLNKYFNKEETNDKLKYIVWIGVTGVHFDNLSEAEQALSEWKRRGYNDARIETKEVQDA